MRVSALSYSWFFSFNSFSVKLGKCWLHLSTHHPSTSLVIKPASVLYHTIQSLDATTIHQHAQLGVNPTWFRAAGPIIARHTLALDTAIWPLCTRRFMSVAGTLETLTGGLLAVITCLACLLWRRAWEWMLMKNSEWMVPPQHKVDL